ncbi:hypothetical protein J3R83DRAFT_2063 [Lanmaoa asiatica]|nr:hypothetical protein J3R83DRAFT_2063 [Lanmaoa asiatica]
MLLLDLLPCQLDSGGPGYVADARTQALAPDLRRKVDANRAARMTQERVLKQQIEALASYLSF